MGVTIELGIRNCVDNVQRGRQQLMLKIIFNYTAYEINTYICTHVCIYKGKTKMSSSLSLRVKLKLRLKQ